ncbi:NAD(+) diphosphatase [Sneathiella marina]|uniref:NAD(+) diphosphatase n=1 Tax=Sneathiella marina TaxID=2950108 RepID=A0ABY4W3X8_9PROT|nr:NAD(+) diphosphatase [Sneathiella marina]USG61743.1 NAD(+) diphosphatase [Sneathiella marina]
MTKPIVFTGSRLDRAAHHRSDPEWLAKKLSDPSSRFLPLHGLKALIDLQGPACIDWRGISDVREFIDAGAPFIFLGIADFSCHFAIDVSSIENPKQPPISDWGKFIDVRSVAAQVRPGDAAALAQARSMIDWHNRHGFCAVCGAKTHPQELGYSRICSDSSCNSVHFPRTDPVAIMMVTKEDKCLLGQGINFPSDFFSCLAGFIEPGETIEQGVRREVFEESGIKVADVRYHASQPWPYPSSLMIGCFADAISEDITVDTSELGDARWFTRDQVREMLASSTNPTGLRMSPEMSLAHQLAKAWLA